MTPYAQMLAQYLPPEYQATFAYECRRFGKDPLLAFLLTVFAGFFGAGDFYLGEIVRGILMLVGTFSGIGAVITVPIWIYRCFTVWSDAENENDYIAYALAYRYLASGTRPNAAPPPPPPQPPRSRPVIGTKLAPL